MEFTLTEQLSIDHQEQLLDLYSQMWWSKHRTQQDLQDILFHSSFVIGILEVKSNHLIGFARVLTDYTTLAYILDVMVADAYRGNALGKLLMHYILDHNQLCHVEKIELACRPEMIAFYQPFGFSETYSDTLIMRRTN